MNINNLIWSKTIEIPRIRTIRQMTIRIEGKAVLTFTEECMEEDFALYVNLSTEDGQLLDSKECCFSTEDALVNKMIALCQMYSQRFMQDVRLHMKSPSSGRRSRPIVIITPTQNIPFDSVTEACDYFGYKEKALYRCLALDTAIPNTNDYIEYAVV